MVSEEQDRDSAQEWDEERVGGGHPGNAAETIAQFAEIEFAARCECDDGQRCLVYQTKLFGCTMRNQAEDKGAHEDACKEKAADERQVDAGKEGANLTGRQRDDGECGQHCDDLNEVVHQHAIT